MYMSVYMHISWGDDRTGQLEPKQGDTVLCVRVRVRVRVRVGVCVCVNFFFGGRGVPPKQCIHSIWLNNNAL